MSLYRQKRSKPFGLPNTPFNPMTGSFFPLDGGLFREFTIVDVGHDVLLCSDQDGRVGLVLKPWSLRKSSFDGKTFGEATYASTGLDTRIATYEGEAEEDEDEDVEESVTKPYFAGEKIMAFRRGDTIAGGVGIGTVAASELAGVTAGDYRLSWEDMNTAGRNWQPPSDGGEASVIAAVGCKGHLTSDLNTSNVTGTPFNWETHGTIDFDTDGFFDPDVSETRFTVPAGLGGTYMGLAGLNYKPNAAGIRQIFLNHKDAGGSVRFFGNDVQNNLGAAVGVGLLTLQYFDANEGDYFEVEAWQNSGGDLEVNGTDRGFLIIIRFASSTSE